MFRVLVLVLYFIKPDTFLSLQIKYGVDKIEVRDTGKGIPSSEVKKAVIGGHTSKLKNQSHLSRLPTEIF